MPGEEKSSGIILRTLLLTETSLIVKWLTPDYGRLSTVAKGARKPGSAFQGKLDLYYQADLTFIRSRRSDLHTLKEIGLRETHNWLRKDYKLLEQLAYCATMLEQSTEEDTPLPDHYQLLQKLLLALPAQPAEPKTVLWFELQMLTLQGLQPDWSDVRINEGAKAVMNALMTNDDGPPAHLKLTGDQHTQIAQFLHGYLIYHLGRIPPNRHHALTL